MLAVVKLVVQKGLCFPALLDRTLSDEFEAFLRLLRCVGRAPSRRNGLYNFFLLSLAVGRDVYHFFCGLSLLVLLLCVAFVELFVQINLNRGFFDHLLE